MSVESRLLQKASNKSKLINKINESIPPYILMVPALIIFFLFTVYPVLWSLVYSMYEYNGTSAPIFIGLENFKSIFNFSGIISDPDSYYSLFWASWSKTLLYTVIKTLIEIPISFVCAYLIYIKVKGSKFFRTLFYMPQILPNMVLFMIFLILLNPYNGFINQLLSNMGIIPTNYSFFSTKESAFMVGILIDTWYYFGLNMLFFVAGLSNVSKQVHESAYVDGANELKTLIYITIPMMARIIQVIVMLSIIHCMRSVGSYFIMTQGGPNHGTELSFLYIYYTFFPVSGTSVARYGYGAAVAIISAVIIGIVTFIYNKLTNKLQYD